MNGAYKIDGRKKAGKFEIHGFRTLDDTQEVNEKLRQSENCFKRSEKERSFGTNNDTGERHLGLTGSYRRRSRRIPRGSHFASVFKGQIKLTDKEQIRGPTPILPH